MKAMGKCNHPDLASEELYAEVPENIISNCNSNCMRIVTCFRYFSLSLPNTDTYIHTVNDVL